MLFCLAGALLDAQEPPPSADEKEPAEQVDGEARRADLNLLGRTAAQAGESRRNENVQFNLIDNNALKELNVRLGTTATLVEEFTPQRNYYGVEFGNAPSSPLHAAPKNASRGVHGNLTATHGNSVFSSRSFFQAGPVRPAHENHYGAAAALPAWRGAFLSLDGSQQKIRGNVNGNVLVPRLDERTPLAADPAIRALIGRWLDAFPREAPNRTDINERALNTNAPQSIDTNTATMRVDQRLSPRDALVFSHAWTTQQVDAFQLVAGQNPDTTTKSHRSRATWNRSYAGGGALDLTAGFDRVRSLLMPEPASVGPQVQVGSTLTALGPGATVPLDRVQNRFRHAAMWTAPRGNHRFVAGGEVARLQFNGREVSSNRGNYYFRNDFGRDALANFRLGIPSRYTTGIGEVDRGFRNWEQHYFAGDSWQALPDLTLKLGVRYQPVTGPREVNRRTVIPYDCDCGNLAPRFGAAYRLPASRGVVRAGYAMEYGEIFAITFQQLRWNPPEFQKIEVQAPLLLDPLRNVAVSPTARSTTYQVPRDLKTPYSHQYNAAWETELGRNWRLQLGYVGSRTHKILVQWHTNRAIPVAGIPQTTATINDRRPDPRYFELRRVVNGSRAYFDAGRATLVAPRWRGLTVDASYWFSKALDTGAAYLNTAAGDDSRQGSSQTEFLVHEDLKAVSAFDQSHAALVRLRYETPAVRGRGARLLGGWALSAVWLGKSGLPFTVISGSDAPGYGNVDGSTGDRPHILDPSILGRTVGNPDTSLEMLPRAAFGYMQPFEARGNLGMNTFRRGSIRNVNASLERTWKVVGERTLLFRAESINFSNTPQFMEPNNDLTSPAFGKVTNTLNDGRSFQFTLQLRF